MINFLIFLASDSLSAIHLRPARTVLPDFLDRKWHRPVARRIILPFLVILKRLVIDFLVFMVILIIQLRTDFFRQDHGKAVLFALELFIDDEGDQFFQNVQELHHLFAGHVAKRLFPAAQAKLDFHFVAFFKKFFRGGRPRFHVVGADVVGEADSFDLAGFFTAFIFFLQAVKVFAVFRDPDHRRIDFIRDLHKIKMFVPRRLERFLQ